jgi:hypothetical protein
MAISGWRMFLTFVTRQHCSYVSSSHARWDLCYLHESDQTRDKSADACYDDDGTGKASAGAARREVGGHQVGREGA